MFGYFGEKIDENNYEGIDIVMRCGVGWAFRYLILECGTRKKAVEWESDSSEKLQSLWGYCVVPLTTICSASYT